MVRIGNRDERGRYELDGMGVFGIYYQHKKDQFVQIDAAAVWPASSYWIGQWIGVEGDLSY